MITLRTLNEVNNTEFISILSDIFEHSPWVAASAAIDRPFSSVDALHESMVNVVKNAAADEKLTLIRAHPDLGDKVKMSEHSKREQQGAGLKDLSDEEYENFLSLNQRYRSKFGFPFIMAVKNKDKHDIYREMETRINHTETIEFETALSEIYKIAFFRLQEKVI